MTGILLPESMFGYTKAEILAVHISILHQPEVAANIKRQNSKQSTNKDAGQGKYTFFVKMAVREFVKQL